MRCLAVLVIAAGAWAQTNEPVLADRALLEAIKQREIEEIANVPNYVCVDSVSRSLWIPAEGRFRHLDRVHVDLAHVEGADRFAWLGASTFQSRSPTQLVGYGVSFGGDFADTRRLVFGNNSAKILYSGRETVGGRQAMRFEYDIPHGALGISKGKAQSYASARGSFWVDAETLDLLRMDMEAYAIPEPLRIRAISDSTTYWRVVIGKRIALLARGSDFRLTEADGIGRRNTSVFSNCREYAAESKLTFESKPTGSDPANVVASSGEDLYIPPGVQLQLVLDKTLDANQAAVGDLIKAHVLKGDQGVPSGAQVYGHVSRIVNYNNLIPLPKRDTLPPAPGQQSWQHNGEVVIQIVFSEIEYRRTRAPFVARLIDLVASPGKPDPDIRSFGYLDGDLEVKYDPPGTASVYVSNEKPLLGRDVVMQWVMARATP
jgi:hypothetical protein